MVVGAEQGDGGRGLGEPVGVHETGAREQLEGPLQHRQRHAGAAVGQRAQRGHGGRRTVEVGHDPGQHGRHDHGLGDALTADGVEPDLWVEGVEVDDPAPGVDVRQQVGHARDVVRRHGHQRGLIGLGAGELDRADHVRGEVTVAQQRRLRGARGARGVEHHRDVLGVHERRQLDLTGGRERRVDQQATIDSDRGIGAGDLAALGHDHRPGVGLHQRRQLLVTQPVVQRDERHPGVGRAEQGDREAGVVGAAVHEPGRAVLDELARHPAGGGIQLGVGERHIARHDRHPIVQGGRRHLQQQREVHQDLSPTTEAAWRP